MRNTIALLAIFILMAACTVNETPVKTKLPVGGPIQLHPENPHYFLYKGKALALITSAEHYGAVLNLDFDYHTYLKTLSDEGMNYTRIFSGSYFEIPGESFGIQNNTLAPIKTSIMTPWAMVIDGQSGEWKYDLSSWNEGYFQRLHDFMTIAGAKDIIVELTLFSSIYRDEHWDICPQNPANNINMKGQLNRFDAQTLNNGELLTYQLDFVRKMVNELNGYDNFFFEIQNEPWSDHTVPVYNIMNKDELRVGDWTFKADFADEFSMAWQEKIASVIAEEEEGLAQKHLIAQNYTNFRASVPAIGDHVSILNFHYAWPDAVRWNYHYDKVLGFDESGFAGAGDQVYRRQAWQFILSGGALFNNLDYSFFVGHEDGRGTNSAPGGGSQELRFQLKVLSEFIHGFPLEKLVPEPGCVLSSPGLIPFVLSDRNGTYAVYLRATGTKKSSLLLETGNGSFRLEYLNTLTGSWSEPVLQEAVGGVLPVDVVIPEGELALKITGN